MTIKQFIEKANIKTKDGRDVLFGDTFWAYIMTPSSSQPTKVTVVEDMSVENMQCNRNYDVEDEKGNSIWNAYMIITDGERGDKPHTWDGGKEYLAREISRLN